MLNIDIAKLNAIFAPIIVRVEMGEGSVYIESVGNRLEVRFPQSWGAGRIYAEARKASEEWKRQVEAWLELELEAYQAEMEEMRRIERQLSPEAGQTCGNCWGDGCSECEGRGYN